MTELNPGKTVKTPWHLWVVGIAGFVVVRQGDETTRCA